MTPGTSSAKNRYAAATRPRRTWRRVAYLGVAEHGITADVTYLPAGQTCGLPGVAQGAVSPCVPVPLTDR